MPRCLRASVASLIVVHFVHVACDVGILASLSDIPNADEDDLVSALAENSTAARVHQIEGRLRHTFAALPKASSGRLGPPAVRYVLFRFFVQEHSWYVRGLEPSDASVPVYIGGESISKELQTMLNDYLTKHGMTLSQTASLAAFIETLVSKEATARLAHVYQLLNLSLEGRLVFEDVRLAVTTYMMLYLKKGMHEVNDFTNAVQDEGIERALVMFKSTYGGWLEVEDWLREAVARHLEVEIAEQGTDVDFAGFADMSRMIEELVQTFGSFNERDCSALRSTMLEMQVPKTGRVRLSDFYAKSLSAGSHWDFNEKVEYLRDIGALDELSDPVEPRVLIPNYISSPSNCLDSSTFYSVCCRNACEQLMGKLEVEVAAPIAEPMSVTSFATAQSATLSQTLVRRLDEIAGVNSGKVPIHSRLFAQWMHHAFPEDCPYPHVTGTINPQAPDEWIKQTGREDTRESEERMWSHVEVAKGRSAVEVDTAELHWSDVEESYCGVERSFDDVFVDDVMDGYVGMAAPSSLRIAMWCSGLGLATSVACYLIIASLAGGLSAGFAANFFHIVGIDVDVVYKYNPAFVKKIVPLLGSGLLVLCLIAIAVESGVLDRFAFVSALGLGSVAAWGRAKLSKPVAPAKKMDDCFA